MFEEEPMVNDDLLLMSLSAFSQLVDQWSGLNHEKVKRSDEDTTEAYKSGREFHPAYEPADAHADVISRAHHESALRTLSIAGVYAPSLEGLLRQQFTSLREPYDSPNMSLENLVKNEANRRWCIYDDDPDSFWEIDKIVEENGCVRKNIVEGFAQLRDALSVGKFFEQDDIRCFEALFAFRNKVFHNGYYWPMSERLIFLGRIKEMAWTDLFDWCTEGEDPGIFHFTKFMEKKLFDTCLGFTDSYTIIWDMEKDFGLKRSR